MRRPAASKHRRTAWAAALSIAGLFLTLGPSTARAEATLELKLRAAFLYNFAKFVEWPAHAFSSPDDPLVICIDDAPELATVATEALTGKPAGSRQVLVRSGDQIHDDNCHIRYGDGAAAPSRPTLTVGGDREFLDQGGMIHLTLVDQRMRFSVNLPAARNAGLSLSAKLLALAAEVRRDS